MKLKVIFNFQLSRRPPRGPAFWLLAGYAAAAGSLLWGWAPGSVARAQRPASEGAAADRSEPASSESGPGAGGHGAEALPDDLFSLDEVVVTGARTEERRDKAVIAPDVIDRETIERSGAEHAGELLEDRVGIQVGSSFRGQALRMQGMEPEHTLVLIDGQRVVGRTDGVVDLSRFPAEQIERIEIVRGASSALYGADAMGGVINIITRSPEHRNEAEGHLAYGYMSPLQDRKQRSFFGRSGHMVDLSGATGIRRGDVQLHITGGLHYTDPFDRDRSTEATDGPGYEDYQARARFGWQPDGKLSLKSSAAYRLRDVQAVEESAAGAVFDRRQRLEEVHATLAPTIETGEHTATLRGHYTLTRNQFVRDQRGSNRLDSFEDNREQLGELALLDTFEPNDRHRLVVGGETFLQVLDSPRITSSGRRGRVAAFAQYRGVLFEDPLVVISPGARVDGDTQFGTAVSPKLALRVDPHERLTVRASAGRGFRAPSFRELLLRFENPTVGYVVEGNPDLRPETSWNVQLGAELQATDDVMVEASLYRNQLRNLIQTTATTGVGGDLFVYTNVAQAYTQGVEANSKLSLPKGVSAQLGYTFLDSRDEERDRPLEGRARHRGVFRLRYRHEASGVEALARGSVVGPRPFYLDENGDGESERVRADAYVPLDLRVGVDVLDELTLFVGIDNVLDTGGRFLGTRPRTVYGGLTARYEGDEP